MALFEDQRLAIMAVKEFNAGKSDEFRLAVERSRDRLRELMPSKELKVEDIATIEEGESGLPTGKMARLMRMLEREARDTPCDLDRLRSLSESYRLDWSWVEESLNKLASAGVITFPRPWTVRLVEARQSEERPAGGLVDVSRDIVRFLTENGGSATLDEIFKHFAEHGILQASIELSLDRLMQSGKVYRTSAGKFHLL